MGERLVFGADLRNIGVRVERHFLVDDLRELLSGLAVAPVEFLLGLGQLALDDLVHGVLEAVHGRQPVEALVTAEVPQTWRAVVADGRFFVVEVRVRVDYLTAFVALLRCFPREVLQSRLQVPMVVLEDKFRPQLLGHELLWRRHPRRGPQTLL